MTILSLSARWCRSSAKNGKRARTESGSSARSRSRREADAR
nr:MAG TPA: hypothetical protein [Caudoviricetes sp.]DAY68131.1 MAG TPA: hypothetical protein [Caudoviricetes sp.]